MLRTIVILGLVAMTSPSYADACFESPAVCAIAEGKALLATDPAQAARRFYASYQLDPKLTTLGLYALALTKAQDYVPAFTAWTRVKSGATTALAEATARRREVEAAGDAAKLSQADEDLAKAKERLDNATAALADVATRVGRVKLRFANGLPPGLVIARDGQGDISVDDTLEIAVRAGGDTLRLVYRDGRKQAIDTRASAGQVETIAVPDIDAKPANPPAELQPPARVVADEPGTWTTRRKVALGLGVVGLAAVGTGLVLGSRAKSEYDRAHDDGHCDSNTVCDRIGFDQIDHAHDVARLSTIATISGALVVATATVLWVTGGSKRETAIAVSIGPSFTGFTLTRAR